MKKIVFTKMSGAGNDFIVIDKTRNKIQSLNKNQIKNICNRRNGVGGDGIILISDSKTSNFTMEYYNSDGSTGSLCGNGARCAIKFAADSNRIKNGKATFQINSEVYNGEIIRTNEVKFELKPPTRIKLNFRIKAASQLIKANFVDTGSPHVVIEIEDVLALPKDLNSKYRNIENFPVFEIGKEIRYHKDFSPNGTNVNFIQVKNEEVFIRTYERGVENETLACGTGSVAAAIIANTNKKISSPIKIKTWSGETLIVDFQNVGNRYERVSLTGLVKTIFLGELNLSDF